MLALTDTSKSMVGCVLCRGESVDAVVTLTWGVEDAAVNSPKDSRVPKY